jgi:hypothetical protein
MKSHKHKCGCISEVGDRERWVSLCPQHEEEFQAIHKRWAEEHKDRPAADRKLLVGYLK